MNEIILLLAIIGRVESKRKNQPNDTMAISKFKVVENQVKSSNY